MAKSNISKKRRATPKPMRGFILTDNQKRTIGNVTKLLVQAQCYLEAEDVDNTMECYEEFVALYRQITRALNKSYDIMKSHNITEQTYYLAKTEMSSLYGNSDDSISGSTQGIIN